MTAGGLATCCIVGGHRPPLQRRARHHAVFVQSPNWELPYQPWAAELVKKRSEGIGKDDPVALCQPAGVMRLHTYPPLRKIVQNPGLTLILSERDVTFRQIFTDGRPLAKDPNPSFNGYSVGRWESDTLIVETTG